MCSNCWMQSHCPKKLRRFARKGLIKPWLDMVWRGIFFCMYDFVCNFMLAILANCSHQRTQCVKACSISRWLLLQGEWEFEFIESDWRFEVQDKFSATCSRSDNISRAWRHSDTSWPQGLVPGIGLWWCMGCVHKSGSKIFHWVNSYVSWTYHAKGIAFRTKYSTQYLLLMANKYAYQDDKFKLPGTVYS